MNHGSERMAFSNVPDMNWMSYGRLQCLCLSRSSKASSEDSHAATWWYCCLKSMDRSIGKTHDNNAYTYLQDQCTDKKNTEYITPHMTSCYVWMCYSRLLIHGFFKRSMQQTGLCTFTYVCCAYIIYSVITVAHFWVPGKHWFEGAEGFGVCCAWCPFWKRWLRLGTAKVGSVGVESILAEAAFAPADLQQIHGRSATTRGTEMCMGISERTTQAIASMHSGIA